MASDHLQDLGKEGRLIL